MAPNPRETAFDDLARNVGPMALAIAQRMLGNEEQARDAVQDAFLNAYRALPGFRGEAQMRTWFIRIVINSCRRQRSLWTKLNRLLSFGDPAVDTAPAPLPGLPDPGLSDRIRVEVSRLPHRQQTAFVLRYGEEMSLSEIAEVMDCPVQTVKSNLFKAVDKLRLHLGPEV